MKKSFILLLLFIASIFVFIDVVVYILFNYLVFIPFSKITNWNEYTFEGSCQLAYDNSKEYINQCRQKIQQIINTL